MADTRPEPETTPPENPWRKPVAWGRLPPQTFQVGVPGQTQSQAAPRRALRPSPTFLQDSMLPARPEPSQVLEDITPLQAAAPGARPRPEPAPTPTAPVEPPKAMTPAAAPAPAAEASVEVPVFAQPRKAGPSKTVLIGGGVAAVLALGAVVYMVTRPGAPDPAPAAVTEAPAVIEPAPVDAQPAQPEPTSAPEPVPVATQPEPTAAATRSPAAAPRTTASAPASQPSSAPAAARVEAAPPVAQPEAAPPEVIQLPVATPPPPVQTQPAPPPRSASEDATVDTRPTTIPEN